MNIDINVTKQEISFDETLDKYLRDQLSESEEATFCAMLQSSPDLMKKADITARMIKGMKVDNDLRDKRILDSLHSVTLDEVINITSGTSRNSDKKLTSTMPMRRISWFLSIAASVIILFTFGYYQYSDYEFVTGLGDEYCGMMESSGSYRAAGDNVEEELNTLFRDVQIGNNLTDASNELNELWVKSLSDTYNDYTNHSIEIGWWLTICYLKDNDRDKAIEILNQMQQTDELNTADSIKISNLLEKLNE